MTIRIPFTGNQPTYAHPDDAGADLDKYTTRITEQEGNKAVNT